MLGEAAVEGESTDLGRSIPAVVIDQQQLQEYSGGDRVFEQELLHLFVEDTQHHLVALSVAIADQDFEVARREAHYIKGASAHVGALAMSAISAVVEDHMKQQTSPIPEFLLDQLVTAYQDVILQTEQWDQDLTALSSAEVPNLQREDS